MKSTFRIRRILPTCWGTFHFSIPSPTLVPLRTRTHVKGPRDRAEIINVARSKNHTPYPSSTGRVEGSGGYIKLCRIFNMCHNIGIPTNEYPKEEDESTIPIIDKTIPPSSSSSSSKSGWNRFVSVDRGGRACTARLPWTALRQWPMMKLSSDNGSITLHRLQWGPARTHTHTHTHTHVA